MAKALIRRIAAAACCALALIIMVAAMLTGIHRADAATGTHMKEMVMDASVNASRYVCTYFDSLMRENDALSAFIVREDDMLSDAAMATLSEATDMLPADTITITRADGAYASTDGARGTGEAAEELLGGAGDVIAAQDGSVRVTTRMLAGGEFAGAISGAYSAEKLAAALNMTLLDGKGCFAIFKPSGEYVMRPQSARMYTSDENIYSAEAIEYARGYSAEKLQTDVKAGRSGDIEYTTSEGVRVYGYYMLLGINDWYIICAAPHNGLSAHAADSRDIIIIMSIAMIATAAALACVLISIFRRQKEDMRKYAGELENIVRKQRLALGTLGAPTFEFDMRALAARPMCAGKSTDEWLLERILIPEYASEIVDAQDEAAYLKLCDALLNARGKVSGDLRLRRKPDAPTRMYRLTLSEPEFSGDNISVMATMVDLDDVAQRMDALRQRAACDDVTGLATASEMRIQAGRLLNRPNHHFGTLAFVRSDNQDAVCDACADLTRDELMRMCAGMITDAFNECDVFARGAGNEFWVFSGDQTGVEIIQKGMNKVMDSALGGDVHLTFSCGIAHADPEDDIDALMERAYAAAQLAHRDGGHRVQHG